MTREEAQKRADKIFEAEGIDNTYLAPALMSELIDDIFDDFEEMNCNNCKHLDSLNICWNKKSPWFDMHVCDQNEDPSVVCCKFFERG